MRATQPYNKIIIEPFSFVQVEQMIVTKKPNEHTKMCLSALIDDKLHTTYAEDILDKKDVKISAWIEELNANSMQTEKKEKIIFCGQVENIEILSERNHYQLKLEAVSHSKKLDVEKIDRSFQQFSMTYVEMMHQVIGKTEYMQSEAALIDKATNGERINQFIIQYHETAWEFLKRMASHFYVPLIVEDKIDRPIVTIGMPQNKEIGCLEDFRYSIKKEVGFYRESTENFKQQMFESECIFFTIETDKIFEIGDTVTFKDIALYVIEANICIIDGMFQNKYKLSVKKGLHRNIIKNKNILGLSLEGVVKEVENDKVKILLDIDKEKPLAVSQELCWFIYSTFYTSNNGGGFYCMPELEEKVRLYFPDTNDENAFALNSVRTQFMPKGNRGNPDVKYLRTKDGKEIIFSPNGISIICSDNEIFIELSAENGILVNSSKLINFIAGEGAGVEINAEGSIVLAANKEIDISCNGSRLNMKNGITKLRGTSITEN